MLLNWPVKNHHSGEMGLIPPLEPVLFTVDPYFFFLNHPILFSHHGDPRTKWAAVKENGWMDYQHGGEETMRAFIWWTIPLRARGRGLAPLCRLNLPPHWCSSSIHTNYPSNCFHLHISAAAFPPLTPSIPPRPWRKREEFPFSNQGSAEGSLLSTLSSLQTLTHTLRGPTDAAFSPFVALLRWSNCSGWKETAIQGVFAGCRRRCCWWGVSASGRLDL